MGFAKQPAATDGFRRAACRLVVAAALAVLVCALIAPLFERTGCVITFGMVAHGDLETIVRAIQLHDSQEPPLRGAGWKPQLGRYRRDPFVDPWGRRYLLDADVGVVLSLGRDGLLGPLSTDRLDLIWRNPDHDVMLRFKPELAIAAAQYDGPSGPARAGNRFVLRWNKPFRVRPGCDPLHELVLVDPVAGVQVRFSGGAAFDADGDGHEPACVARGWVETRWSYDQATSRPAEGVMVLLCVAGPGPAGGGGREVEIGRDAAVDVSRDVLRRTSESVISVSGIEALPARGGPCDARAHGSRALDPGRAHPLRAPR